MVSSWGNTRVYSGRTAGVDVGLELAASIGQFQRHFDSAMKRETTRGRVESQLSSGLLGSWLTHLRLSSICRFRASQPSSSCPFRAESSSARNSPVSIQLSAARCSSAAATMSICY